MSLKSKTSTTNTNTYGNLQDALNEQRTNENLKIYL